MRANGFRSCAIVLGPQRIAILCFRVVYDDFCLLIRLNSVNCIHLRSQATENSAVNLLQLARTESHEITKLT